MFSARRIGLFDSIPCPDISTCSRNPCLFSHKRGLVHSSSIAVPVSVISTKAPDHVSSVHRVATPTKSILKPTVASSSKASIPTKRPITYSSSIKADPPAGSIITSRPSEPPSKFQRLNTSQRAVPALAQPSSSSISGVPTLIAHPATSTVALNIRQTCLKSLFDAFVHLYSSFHAEHPHFASKSALAQEADVYSKTNKQTYRQGIVSAIVAIKKRPAPLTPKDDTVGSEAEYQARLNVRKITRVEARHLEQVLLTRSQMIEWGFVVDIPTGPGGDKPNSEGDEEVCERCTQRFIVTPLGLGKDEACSFHWARPFTTTSNGEKIKTYKCCAMVHPGPGCARGPHVFYEKAPEDLHRRHPFTRSSHPAPNLSEDAVLDVAAIDCEMIYTTGGMHVARVSVVDGDGKAVFDEFVRLSEGVKVIDYLTRYSGITPELLESAVLDLNAIRQALRAFIGPKTILIGHALDNDLKTLRMVHHRVVDTCILFPHRGGAPFRRALRDIVSEKLQKMIQSGGGKTGHSSVEDAIATLDLVRWWIANERPWKPGVLAVKGS
ncbi:Rexo1 protein [Hysterangium stoloniferum]|nr:Rexo1 protein [Hysterangium stoloniferum]